MNDSFMVSVGKGFIYLILQTTRGVQSIIHHFFVFYAKEQSTQKGLLTFTGTVNFKKAREPKQPIAFFLGREPSYTGLV